MRLRNVLLALAGSVAAPAWSQGQGGAVAAADAPFNLNFTLAAVTDSRERGLSNSANRPTVRASMELLHASGAFAELEVLRVSKAQYPLGQGVRMQAVAGYRWGNPDEWHYELGGLYSHFPGSKLPGLSGYHLTMDPDLGEIIDVTPTPGDVNPATAELVGRISYRGFSLRYYHTVSKNFYGISSKTVCAGLKDLSESYECYQEGLKNSRGSGYVEIAYLHRLSKAAAVELRLGHQQVRHFRDFDALSFSVEYRHLWRGSEFSAAVVGARPRTREVYAVETSGGKTRDSAKTTLVLGVSRSF